MQRRTILIVDDSETDRLILKRHLGRDGAYEYRFVEAEMVGEGLAAMSQEPPDCVLLDYALPDGTALDFIEATRRTDGALALPIVIQTGTGSQANAVALMKAGAHDYLVKGDITAEALRLAVNSAIYRVETAKLLDMQREELRVSLAETKAAKEEAEKASAAKDDFLAMLSHELRTPLTPVLSAVSSALGEDGLPPETRDIFALIQRNVQLEARLIDDLLDLTRVIEGRFEVVPEPMDLHTCLRGAVELATAALATKNLTIETRLTAVNSSVIGDFARLQQLLWTVLKNAVDFNSPGGVVRIATTNIDGKVRVEIADSGQGIAAEDIGRVFDAFQRPGGYKRFGTLGIGLKIARSIAEAHGGSLTATSSGVGHGAAFLLELPAHAYATPSTNSNSTAASRQETTILVVEDHEDTRRALARALQRRGFEVLLAGSVAEARERLGAGNVQLIVCDIGLPDGSGWDVMQGLGPGSGIRAIAVTGYGMESDIEKSRLAGFDTHITKPIEFQRLEKLIESLLSLPTPAGALPR